MKKQLKLERIKIRSFVTGIEDQSAIKGGSAVSGPIQCETAIPIFCPTDTIASARCTHTPMGTGSQPSLGESLSPDC